MFKILDGRDKFYQWDKNRKLLVEDSSINEVHFCNRYGNCSIIRATYQLEGKTLVDVPNVILQDSFKLHTYAFDTEYTKHEDVFEIVARTKPEDYVNTEEDVKLWDELAQKLIDLESKIDGEGIQAAVIKYLTDNPPEAGATQEEAAQIEQNRADIEELRGEVAAIEIPDVSNFATTGYVDEKIAEIDFPEGADLTGYATKSYVDEAIDNIEHPTVNLDGYALKTYVDEAIQNIDIPEAKGTGALFLNLRETSSQSRMECGEKMLEFIEAFLANPATPVYIMESISLIGSDNKLYDKGWCPAIAEKVSDEEIVITRAGVTYNELGKPMIRGVYELKVRDGVWKHHRKETYTCDLVTELEVDTKIADALSAIINGEEVSY